jgi:hypothetical protein
MTSIYNAGTAAVANGNAVVTGTGTAWAVSLIVGGLFSCAGLAIPIASVDSDTSLTLAYAWPGSTVSGVAYAIARENSDAAAIVDVYDRMTQVLRTLALAGVHPNESGSIAKRDTIAASLGSSDEGYIFLHAEPGVAFVFYRWTGTVWDGPFDQRGPSGVGSGGLGLPAPGAANKFPYYTGANTVVLGDLTVAGRNLLDDPDVSAQLTTLGFSTFFKTLIDDANAAAVQATISAQPADANLTSWSFARASGFDAFAAGATSALLKSLMTDETGSGGLVFSTSATMTGLVLAAGTATVAPLNMTAGVLLTTATAGSWNYDGKALYFAHAASSRGVVAVKQIAAVQAATVALSNSLTTAQNIFPAANDTLTLLANTSYRFRAKIGLNTGATSHTTAFQLGGTATFTSISYLSQATSSAANTLAALQSRRVETAAAAVLTAASTAVSTDLWIEGVLRTNGAGTIVPQVTFSAGPTGTCEVAINSFFEIEPIGSDTVAAVGNWS